MPDYRVTLDEETDLVTFYNRDRWWEEKPTSSNSDSLPPLPSDAYEEAREAAPGYDISALEADWRDFWACSGKPKIENVAAAFVGFCRSRHKRAPIQRAKDAAWDE